MKCNHTKTKNTVICVFTQVFSRERVKKRMLAFVFLTLQKRVLNLVSESQTFRMFDFVKSPNNIIGKRFPEENQ